MGQAVIGGVITASLLTLVVVPVVYCYMDDLSRWLKRLFGVSENSGLSTEAATGSARR
jgi:HAE1 family hydrophobic/amphiphilic exporter-1